MSAHLCSTATLRLIATYAATVSPTNDIMTVWRQLITENLKSLNHRYPTDQADNVKTAAAEIALICDSPFLPLPDPGIIRSALTEFRYQACEHSTYDASPAGVLVQQLLDTIDAPMPDHPAGWYPIDELPQPEPQPLAASPAPDPIASERARLTAAFNAPSAQTPAPGTVATAEPDSLAALPVATRGRALIQLLTLSRVSGDHPDGVKFAELAAIVGATLSTDARATASATASANAAALRSVLDCMDGRA